MASMQSALRVVVWLRNDLRLLDNPVLHEAARRARAAVSKGGVAEVLPVYIFDPALLGGTHPERIGGLPRYSHAKAHFELDCVLDLKSRLRSIGSDLLIAVGSADDVMCTLCGGSAATTSDDGRAGTTVLVAAEVTSEEVRAERRVSSAMRSLGNGSHLEVIKSANSMYDADDVAALFGARCATLPDVFTPFRNKVESRLEVPPALKAPARGSLPLPSQTQFGNFSLDFMPTTPAQLGMDEERSAQAFAAAEMTMPAPKTRSAFPFGGGETNALKRLQSYLWDTDNLSTYFDTRNGMLGSEYSSKFSPYLARGCLSARTIHDEVRQYEKARVSNKSTYWLIFELIWRDFFRFFAMKHGDAIFKETGTMPMTKRGLLAWRGPDAHADECLERWRYGRTGFPLVDANMRELLATGFMSNRGRQNVASFLVFDYGLDWRLGASWFESTLIDYDVCSNWGNWVAAAGLTGGRLNRFNVTKQQRDYDPTSAYVRAWIPESETIHRIPTHKLGDGNSYGVLGMGGGGARQHNGSERKGNKSMPTKSRQRTPAKARPRGRVF